MDDEQDDAELKHVERNLSFNKLVDPEYARPYLQAMRYYIIILIFVFGQSCATDSDKNSLDRDSNKLKTISAFENKFIGMWKLQHSSYIPIRLPNFNGEYEELTLTMDSSRKAIFYSDNLKQSVAEYEWNADFSMIKFLSGDVISSANIQFINDSSLSFIIFKVVEDTLTFKRI